MATVRRGAATEKVKSLPSQCAMGGITEVSSVWRSSGRAIMHHTLGLVDAFTSEW